MPLNLFIYYLCRGDYVTEFVCLCVFDNWRSYDGISVAGVLTFRYRYTPRIKSSPPRLPFYNHITDISMGLRDARWRTRVHKGRWFDYRWSMTLGLSNRHAYSSCWGDIFSRFSFSQKRFDGIAIAARHTDCFYRFDMICTIRII